MRVIALLKSEEGRDVQTDREIHVQAGKTRRLVVKVERASGDKQAADPENSYTKYEQEHGK